MIPGTVKSITVSGVYGQGDYDLSTEKWKFGANDPSSTYVIEPKDARVNAGVITPLTNKNSALMMIPQPLGPDAKVSMVFDDGATEKTVSFRLNGTSWKAGNHITYVLSSSKITTLKMGRLDYPAGWNSVNDGATYKIRKAYDRNTSAGLFVVNEKNMVIAANVQLTYDGTSWSLPKDSKLKFSPQYNYFVYYPYQANLAGLPAVNTPGCDVSSSTKFFAKAIANWKIATDQSTLEKMNACDLQIGNASLDEDGCSVSFEMEHAMGLAEITLGAKTFDNNYYLSNYPSYTYTWKNGTTTFHAYAGISGHSFYKVADYRYVALVKPDVTTDFSCSSSTDPDSWTENVSVKPAANGVDKVTATSKRTSWPNISYTMEVGDIYYNNGGITKPTKDEIAAARKNGLTTIGIIGYLGNDYWTESNTGSGYGGHALVMCLKTIGSTGSTKAAQEDFKNNKSVDRPIVKAYIGTGYAWSSDSHSDTDLTNVTNKDLIVDSKNQPYGSGYTATAALIKRFGPDEATAYYQAHIYNTLPANSSKCTGWFLPTAGQYYAVMTTLGAPFSDDWTGIWDGNTSTHPKLGFFDNMKTVTTNINNKLMTVGDLNYTEFFGDINTWAWTSSEYSSTTAVIIDSGVDDSKGSGSVRSYNGDKTPQFPVRPFLAF